MYSNVVKKSNKGKVIDKTEFIDIDGFLMGSNRKVFKINDCSIKKIKVVNKKLANPLVSKKVEKLYQNLISVLTELLIDDDDSGDAFREALNRIEKFRLEIKVKYRKFLKQKELEKMAKQLKILQKNAEARLLEVQNSFYEQMRATNESKRSR